MDESVPAILDACVCINLSAALGTDIGDMQATRGAIVPHVAQETLFLHDEQGDEKIETRVALQGVPIVQLTDDESARYVAFAARLDDGEAASLAVAATRGWTLATDDRAAIRQAQLTEPPVQIATTAMLLRRHSQAAHWDAARIAEAVRNVRDRAAFVPPRSDPEYHWWKGYL